MKKPVPAESVDPRLIAANTAFGFNLFRELQQADSGQNIFISPASVAMTLAMTYNGANGETQKAMAKTLKLQGMSLEEVNRANAGLKTILENPDPEVQLTVANSLWAEKGIEFKPEFSQRNRDYYAAEAKTLDFSHPGAAKAINDWVKNNTGGQIDKIVERIDALRAKCTTLCKQPDKQWGGILLSQEIHVVTGAFGYSGKYIARRLIDSGYSVRTLTNSVNRFNPFGDQVEVYPFNFDNHEKLTESLKGAAVLYNTYW